jgi:hypothetical protein
MRQAVDQSPSRMQLPHYDPLSYDEDDTDVDYGSYEGFCKDCESHVVTSTTVLDHVMPLVAQRSESGSSFSPTKGRNANTNLTRLSSLRSSSHTGLYGCYIQQSLRITG